ncbi:STAS domain protein [Maioricimonas rarisocia]|uniref:STAS domain protein n=1 Tax=Maioricimonas rarisocia TaxID=2528026 RepID=A0A517ZCB0_9PLAN|nr:STAS domain-containing protein [Maioricimonas rarisocia]QDU40136.1 STAS domain protein [Maioricimonas rarisocia]
MFTRSRQGAVDVITGDAPLNVDSCNDVLHQIEACLSHGQPRLVIDLRDIPFIDSAGLELLLDVQDRCVQAGGTCKLAAPNPLCTDILYATAVGLEFETYPDAISAAGSFAL